MREQGFTLLEVIVAIGLVMALAVGMIATNQLAGAGLELSQVRADVGRLSSEGMEAVMSIRADDFASFTVGTFHPVYDGSTWRLVGGEEVIDGVTRRVVVSGVARSLACDKPVCPIVEGGGFIDEDSFWVKVEVEWVERGKSKETSLESLITFWR